MHALNATPRTPANCSCGGTIRLTHHCSNGRTAALATCRTCGNQATACGPSYTGAVRAVVVALRG